jgi:hypothetical protein
MNPEQTPPPQSPEQKPQAETPTMHPPVQQSGVITPNSDAEVDPSQVHAQFGGTNLAQTKPDNPLVKAMLWLFSGFAVLLVVIILNIIMRFTLGTNPFVDIISYILGIAGVILLFYGPYRAIMILIKNK